MNPKIYVSNEGKLLYLQNVPEEPKYILKGMDVYKDARIRDEYQSLLSEAIKGGVEFEKKWDVVCEINNVILDPYQAGSWVEENKRKFFDIPSGYSVEVKEILNNGAEHDGHQCEYTMCYFNNHKIKDKCLGWCKRVAHLVQKPEPISEKKDMEKTKDKTPISLQVGNHIFLRYLMDNEYAEEMKCHKCGFIIWPCKTEQDGIDAVNSLGGNINKC